MASLCLEVEEDSDAVNVELLIGELEEIVVDITMGDPLKRF